jgi:hypothetical protein
MGIQLWTSFLIFVVVMTSLWSGEDSMRSYDTRDVFATFLDRSYTSLLLATQNISRAAEREKNSGAVNTDGFEVLHSCPLPHIKSSISVKAK